MMLAVRRIYQDRRFAGQRRCGVQFTRMDPAIRNALLLRTIACPDTWQNAHVSHTRSNLMMGYYFVKGIIGCFLPAITLKRRQVRHPQLKLTRVDLNGRCRKALLGNKSANGRKLVFFAKNIDRDGQWLILESNHKSIPVRNVYLKKILPNFYVAGFELCESQ
jgi:hypothetical protein